MANIPCSKYKIVIRTQDASSPLILTSTYKLGGTIISTLQGKRMKCMGSGEISNCLRL